ncbi:MAG TPA: extracellular solute-binding protein [Candidatus Angelobacter sp.]|nr:extracellular solute-binding protein [Candidatus Angelobacter sp.]
MKMTAPEVWWKRSNQWLRAGSCLFFLCLLFPTAVLPASAPEKTVSVLYAGSLAAVMENGVGPAFVQATGYEYQGEAQGSMGAAQLIHDHLRTPDIFISADPAVNEQVLMGPQNGKLVKWFSVLASSQLVLAYNPNSRFAAKFKEVEGGSLPWYEILKLPGVRFGRGDPSIDPKGYRTLFMFRLAGEHYHRLDIPALLGTDMNPAQVFPEIVLLARVESGQFDAGIFYKHEVVAHKLPFINLPAEINLGDPHFAARYGRESYTTPSGKHVAGAPILFTITVPETVKHREAALAFARFLLSSGKLLQQYGLGNVEHQVGGDVTQVPAELREFNAGPFKP